MALPPDTKADDRRAKRKAAEDEIFMKEIDDAVRQDQYANFARTYGVIVIGAIIAVLLALAAYLFWDSRREQSMERDSEALVGALDQVEAGNIATAKEQLGALIDEGDGMARLNAQMLSGGIALEEGRNAEAAALFAAVAADGDAPQALRDLATLREIAAVYDLSEPADLVARLTPLAVPDNAFFGSAGEMLAMAYLDMGNREEAGAMFAQVAKDEETPEGLRSRARQMAGLLGVDAIEDVDAMMEELQIGGDDAATPQPET